MKHEGLTGSILRRLMSRFSGGFAIALHDMPPERLAAFIDAFWPARPVPLQELVTRSKQGKPSAGLFAITVDDGVGDNVRALAQIFRARGWPATFYLPTDYIDTGRLMPFQWWRRLKPLLPRKKLQLKSGPVDLSNPVELDAFSKKVQAMWRRERPDAYLPLTTELVEIISRETGMSADELQTADDAPIPWAEVARLSRDELIRFESHSVSHTAMSVLTEEELVFEMGRSQKIVEEHTGRPCRHFCYPFGSPESIGALAPAVARRFYDSATTMSLGLVDGADPWLLPRIPLYPTNSVLFARMKVLLKCTELNRRGRKLKSAGQPPQEVVRHGQAGAGG
jgi:peptidoglycan/xylan/chitin deacetylase (PgdA/CDA1 family)